MSKSDLTEREFLDVTKLIKIIADSVKTHIGSDPSVTPSSDMALYAMQVLSLVCQLNRGYTKEQIARIWDTSTRLSNKLHAASKSDKVTAKFQGPVNFRYKN